MERVVNNDKTKTMQAPAQSKKPNPTNKKYNATI